jgi:LacI family transcriptional regulator, galactose operon repressor
MQTVPRDVTPLGTSEVETDTMKKRHAGIKDVAEAAGVSLGTVSNVLNRPELVSDQMRAKVQVAIDELGFVRNGSASRLRSSRSDTIGLVVLDVGNPYFTEIARGVEEVAEELGYTVMLCNSDGSGDREERHLEFLEEQRVGGILITPTGPDFAMDRIESLRSRGVAVVLVDEPSTELDRCSVAVDDVQGGELAGRHLIEGGRRRLVFLTGPDSIRQAREREVGLRLAVDGYDGPDDIELHVVRAASMNGRAGYAVTQEILEHRPDAVFASNDLLALGALRGFLELGLDVPGDVAIVGYDDIEFASLAAVPLTSVRQPALQIGRSSARLLLEECSEEDHAHQQVIFRPELVVRDTSRS